MTNFIQERYINPYTDFGFKKLFGTEMNKDLLISFLNALFNGHEVVRDVTYLNSEHFGESYRDRKAIFDVYCENEQGEKFIVEMQKYEESIKVYRDLTNVVNTAERKGREEGREEEKIATVKRLHSMGLSIEQIAQGTGLTIKQVKEIIII